MLLSRKSQGMNLGCNSITWQVSASLGLSEWTVSGRLTARWHIWCRHPVHVEGDALFGDEGGPHVPHGRSGGAPAPLRRVLFADPGAGLTFSTLMPVYIRFLGLCTQVVNLTASQPVN